MSTLRGGAERDDDTDARGDAVPGRDGVLTGREDLNPDPTAEPDPAVVAADDRLLDALGRAESAPGDDPLAGLLTAWRAELHADLPCFDVDAALAATVPRQPATIPRQPATIPRQPAAVPRQPAAPNQPATTPRRSAAVPRQPATMPRRPATFPRRPRAGRLVRRLVLSSVVGVVLTALLGLGVNHAGPTSPLWPVATAVYPDRSAVRAAEHTIQLAREALADHRHTQARAELDRAAVQVTAIRDPAEAGRLRAEIERLRRGLPGSADRSEVPAGEQAPPVQPAPTTPTAPRTPGVAPPPTVGSDPTQPAPATPADRDLLPVPLPVLPSLLPSGLPLLPSGGCVLLCPPD
ncbi:hypothetical protein ABNF97_27765 [Plantactinospora sp. B6F1]|uniref:hypothetical protein n=1 Tax=Plantactinospora sp. B6F1 TaxID=3158971 RepID=UPI0032D901FE